MLTKRRLEGEHRCMAVEGGAEAVTAFIANMNQRQTAALQPLPLPSTNDESQFVTSPAAAPNHGGWPGQQVQNQYPPMFRSDAQIVTENGLQVLLDTSRLTPLPLPSMAPDFQQQPAYAANAMHKGNSGGGRMPLPLPTME